MLIGFNKRVCMNRLIICLILLWLASVDIFANNVRVNGELVRARHQSGKVQLNFSVSWNNAWNDPYNWDAVWVFVKYRLKTDAGAWKHANVELTGHEATGLNLCVGDNGVGVFLFPQMNGAADVTDKGVALVLSELAGIPVDDAISADKVEFSVQLIEMVLVPEGAFYAGDGKAKNTIWSIENADQAALIDKSGALKINVGNDNWTLEATYPKGFSGFYAMKYELSQAQYVDFLNKLSRRQQEYRIPGLASMKPGEYIFGDKTKPSARNGIVVYINEPDRPAIFAHNLTQDIRYNAEDDGQNLACNYLSPFEMLCYCDWAGLRPMTELEFEKSCRRPFPETALVGGYAWNTANYSAVAGEGEVINAYQDTEYVQDAAKNVNAGNHMGPLRCGAFASHPDGVTQESAGASCNGLMEMSGNLREICYSVEASVGYRNIADYLGDGELNGEGIVTTNETFWPQSGFIPKGGGFSSGNTELQVSDRSLIHYITDNRMQDSTLGFRAVRDVPDIKTYADGGRIVGENGRMTDTVVSSSNVISYQVSNQTLPSFFGKESGMSFQYEWYLKKGDQPMELLAGETGESLNLQDVFENTTDNALAYRFRRDARCPGGVISTEELVVWVLNLEPDFSILADVVDGCDVAQGVKVTLGADAVFSWEVNGVEVFAESGKSSTYKAKRTHFGNAEGVHEVICRIKVGKHIQTQPIHITVEPKTTNPADCPCGATIEYEGREYPTVQIGTQCWMAKNLNVGDRVSLENLENAHKEEGVQRGCMDIMKCEQYGGLYTWWEVLCGGECSASFNASNTQWRGVDQTFNYNLLVSYGVKYVPDSKVDIQGICPDGWHLPSDNEWGILEKFIGITDQETYGWDRKGDVKSLMVSGNSVWCPSGDCNTTGFSAYWGGYVNKTATAITADATKSVCWWSGLPIKGGNKTTSIVRGITMNLSDVNNVPSVLPAMGKHRVARNSYMYVRCLRNN